MKLEENIKYWEDAYLGNTTFISKHNKKSLPWDIGTYDDNLKLFLDKTKLKGNVLEVGCGLGYDVEFLRKKGFNVVGLDLSNEAINLAKRNVGKKNTELLVEDIYSYHTDKKFDLIYERGVSHNQQDTLHILYNKYHSLLKDNGYVLVITGNDNSKLSKYTQPTRIKLATIENACRDNFKIISAEETTFKTHNDYDDSLGWKIVLKKKEYHIYV